MGKSNGRRVGEGRLPVAPMVPLDRLSDWHLLVVYRLAKSKLRVFFADPHQMIALRNEILRRGLNPNQQTTPPANRENT